MANQYLLEGILAQAGSALEQGRLGEAERLANTALKISPNFFLCSYILGCALAGQGKFKEAVTHLTKAAKSNSCDHSVHSNLARALMDCGELKKSIPHHQKALALSPNNVNSLLNYGTSLYGLGKHEESLSIFDHILRIAPNNFPALVNKSFSLKALNRDLDLINLLNRLLEMDEKFSIGWNELGCIYIKQGMYHESINVLNKAVLLDPNYAEAYFNLAISLEKSGLYHEALSAYDKVITLGAEQLVGLSIWLNRGVVFHSLKCYEDALISYKKVLDIYPEHAVAHSNIANTLNQMGRHIEALEHCGIALKLKKASGEYSQLSAADILLNQAVAFTALNQIESAKSSYLEAINVDPEHADSRINLMYLYMMDFDFKRGWGEYEWRWLKRPSGLNSLVNSKPTWDGQQRNNRLFIWAEQGIGDQILYSSILTELVEYPQKIMLSVEKKLLPLFKRSFPHFQIFDKDTPPLESDYDEQIPIASIAKYFRGNLGLFPKHVKPYLLDDLNHTDAISARLHKPGRKVCGISWKSSAKNVGEKKSIPLILFEPILKNHCLDFVSLQYGDVLEEVGMVNSSLNVNIKVLDDLNLFDSMDDIASLVKSCDVIVTTSNSTAHIAGAFGKRVILLIPSADDSIWYWHAVNGKSIWYPSIQVLKKNMTGDWYDVLLKASQLLERICVGEE